MIFGGKAATNPVASWVAAADGTAAHWVEIHQDQITLL